MQGPLQLFLQEAFLGQTNLKNQNKTQNTLYLNSSNTSCQYLLQKIRAYMSMQECVCVLFQLGYKFRASWDYFSA